jgi:transposase
LQESYASCKPKEEVRKTEKKKKRFSAKGKKPGKYPNETGEQAVGMFGHRRSDFKTRSECARHVAGSLGVGTYETVTNWAGQAEIDGGFKEGVTIEEKEEIRRLRREVAELKRTNGIPGAASAFFAAEPGRPQSKQWNLRICSKREGKREVLCGAPGRSAKRFPRNAAFRYRRPDITHSKRATNRREKQGIADRRTRLSGYTKRTVPVTGSARYGALS